MTTLEIRRVPAPRAWLAPAVMGVLLLGGLLMLGAAVMAVLTQDLTSNDQIYALFVGGLGVAGVVLGGAGIGDALRLLGRPLVLRLDTTGVWLRTGNLTDATAAAVSWTDVDRVEVGTAVLSPELFPAGGSGRYEVLRFVLAPDAAIEADPPTAYDAVKALALGLPPEQALFAMVLGPSTAQRVPEIRGWLGTHCPGIPFVDAGSTAP